jgi:hypothetical protein
MDHDLIVEHLLDRGKCFIAHVLQASALPSVAAASLAIFAQMRQVARDILHAFATVQHPNNPAGAKAWVEQKLGGLLTDRVGAVWRALKRMRPWKKAVRDALARLIGYVERNRTRIGYQEPWHSGLAGGSGAVRVQRCQGRCGAQGGQRQQLATWHGPKGTLRRNAAHGERAHRSSSQCLHSTAKRASCSTSMIVPARVPGMRCSHSRSAARRLLSVRRVPMAIT